VHNPDIQPAGIFNHGVTLRNRRVNGHVRHSAHHSLTEANMAISAPSLPSAPPAPIRLTRRTHWRRAAVVAGLVLAASVAAVILATPILTETSYWARIVAWREATADDYLTKFVNRGVPNAPPIAALRPAPAEVPSVYGTVTYPSANRTTTAALNAFLSSTGTRALLILRDDSLLLEQYANGSSHTAIQTSFSAAKSFDSTLIGIAIGEGSIGSVDDPVVRYVPELAGRGLESVTIRHLLGMDSGFRYDGAGVGGMPWQDDARTYYDPDLRFLALTVSRAEPPATRWVYNNYHPLLLGVILERATGSHVADYLSEKVWQPIGAEAPASWSLDSRHDGFEKMESGINARAIDFARFGQLWLNNGVAQGKQVVPAEWVRLATQPNAPELKADYGLMWWLDPDRPGRFYAWGNLGQFIYVAPDRNAVVVRMGRSYGGLDPLEWRAVLRDLADRITV
jgi:CubicO group peptidase (beta-lactamase class C family)